MSASSASVNNTEFARADALLAAVNANEDILHWGADRRRSANKFVKSLPTAAAATVKEGLAAAFRKEKESAAATNTSSIAVGSPVCNTAVLLLSCAFARVSSASTTTGATTAASVKSASFDHSEKGTLTLAYTGETLTAEQVQELEAQANQFIAGGHSAQTLTSIAGAAGAGAGALTAPLTAATNEVQKLKILKTQNRKKDNAYEINFVVGASAIAQEVKAAAAKAAMNSKKTAASQAAAATAATATAAAGVGTNNGIAAALAPQATRGNVSLAAAVAASAATSDYITETSGSIFATVILPALVSLQATTAVSSSPASASSPSAATAASQLSEQHIAHLRLSLLPRLESHLTMFANEAYTKGFTAAKTSADVSKKVPLADLL